MDLLEYILIGELRFGASVLREEADREARLFIPEKRRIRRVISVSINIC